MGTGPRDLSFVLKCVGAAAMALLADTLFYDRRAGSTLGLFAAALLILVVATRTDSLRHGSARIALLAAASFAVALAADPGLLPAVLFWTALAMAVQLPRTARFDDGWRWAQRLMVHWLVIPFGPFRDAVLAQRARHRIGPIRLGRKAIPLVLPLAGSLIFVALFAEANPVIRDALAGLDLGLDLDGTIIFRFGFWLCVLILVWGMLRPARFVLGEIGPGMNPDVQLPGVTIASVTLSLAAFNLIFGVQNGLDLAFLWSGAPLPEGVTLAEYAHRGAYPLIATALLAGLFVLITMRPGSATAASRAIRLLVTLWIAQNLLLVASTMLRTFDYIEAYSLTRLRIAALIWMGLVAAGLVLVCYRLLRGKSAAWLINANLLAAMLVLAGATTVDFGRMAAAWNVRHAREAGGRGTLLDLCYLNELGPSALLPLIELERRPLPVELRERVRWLRSRTMAALEESQADWHGWTWRNAQRLGAARAQIEAARLPRHRGEERQCDGRPFPPPPPPPVLEVPPDETATTNGAIAPPHLAETPNTLTAQPER